MPIEEEPREEEGVEENKEVKAGRGIFCLNSNYDN